MTGSMSTFKRYEKKYMLNDSQYAALRCQIAPHTQPDKFGRYSICNIYFDTDTHEIIRRSIEKPVYKEKLRVRSYGTPDNIDTVFFELKKKYKKEVFKRRVSISADALNEYLSTGTLPDANPQVMGEISHFIALYRPRPAIYIAYERVALAGKSDENLRITFDTNIRFRCDNLRLCSGDHGQTILPGSRRLLEIKVRGAMPLWLTRAFSDHQIYPTSFSKYGHCYQNHILTKTTPFSQPAENQYVA